MIGDVLTPREKLVVQRGLAVDVEQVLGEEARRVELDGVYEGGRGHEASVVAVAEHHWHDVVVERAEELLGDVLAAQRVLERHEELVLRGDVSATIGAVWRTRARAALAVHIDGHELAQPVDERSARRRRLAVADQRSGELCLHS